MIYLSANFNSMVDNDDVGTYTPETGTIFTRSSTVSPTMAMQATSGKIHAVSSSDRSYNYSTVEPQTDIDIDFDVTVVSNVSNCEAGVIVRWDESTGNGFGCYLKYNSGITADLTILNFNNSILSSHGVTVASSTTYHVRYSLRKVGGSTLHRVYFNNSTSPSISITSSSGPQVVGKTGVTGYSATSSTGYHLDNLIARTFVQTINSAFPLLSF